MTPEGIGGGLVLPFGSEAGTFRVNRLSRDPVREGVRKTEKCRKITANSHNQELLPSGRNRYRSHSSKRMMRTASRQRPNHWHSGAARSTGESTSFRTSEPTPESTSNSGLGFRSGMPCSANCLLSFTHLSGKARTA